MDEPIGLDIAGMRHGLETGRWSATSLCRAHLEHLDRIDRADGGPALASVIERNPDAESIAAALDADVAGGGPRRGPLHGIPILVKDSIDTGDRMMTTAGSLALVGNRAPRDATVVERLRAAGAVVLGKTNMSEWGYLRSTRPSSGWSSRGGQTRNPYVLDRSPLGSSSGSAVAVAAGGCAVALGAEVDGSIVRPASSNSIVGVKPTVGLVSRDGVIGVAAAQDTVGPMARTVTDAALLLDAIAGPDPRDPSTAGADHRTEGSFASGLDEGALRGARLGVDRSVFGHHEGTDAVIESALDALAALGAELIDPAPSIGVPTFGPDEVRLFQYGMKASVNRYLADHPHAPVRSLDELIAFNAAHADTVMPYFGQEHLEIARALGDLDDPEHRALEEKCARMARADGIDRVLRDARLDAIVAPTESTPAWVVDPVIGDHLIGGSSSPPAMAGYPHVSVPAGFVHGLPVGLSFYAEAYADRRLLGYAYAFEHATEARRPPRFLPTLPA